MSNYTAEYTPDAENNPWNKVFDMVKNGSTVLDVGCSTGNFGEALIKYKGCTVDGIEPDLGDYKAATRKLRQVANSFAEDAMKDTFKNSKYDHIVFLDVIEHLNDPAEVLKMFKSHLKPNGSILFSIPNMAHISVRLMLLGGDFEYGDTGLLDNTHLHFYTLREIERVFATAGYSISKLDHTEATYPPGLVEDQLKKLDIKPNPTLKKLLNKDDARIFQYVGKAEVGKAQNIKREYYSPNPQGTIYTWYQQQLQAKDVEYQQQLQAKEHNISELNNQLEEKTKTLNNNRELARRIRFSQYMKYYIMGKLGMLKRKITKFRKNVS